MYVGKDSLGPTGQKGSNQIKSTQLLKGVVLPNKYIRKDDFADTTSQHHHDFVVSKLIAT